MRQLRGIFFLVFFLSLYVFPPEGALGYEAETLRRVYRVICNYCNTNLSITDTKTKFIALFPMLVATFH